ncbi:MAG: hypothetical protein U5K38_03405 [Woeseiaceae bacterium]|nr:hypothetical protein [Woeseiaceae bacterium]
MNPQLEASIDRIQDRARGRYQHLLEGARSRTEQAAGRIGGGKKPLNTLSNLSIKLSGVSHRTTDTLLRHNTKLLENQLDVIALRFSKAAEARSVRDLIGTQLGLVPEQVGRLATDTRASLGIVLKAGSEARELLKGTVSELRGVRTTPARKPTRKAARKKAAKKTAAGKTSARKAAKQSTAGKTPVRKARKVRGTRAPAA